MHFCEGLTARVFCVYSTSDIPTHGFQLDVLGVFMAAGSNKEHGLYGLQGTMARFQ